MKARGWPRPVVAGITPRTAKWRGEHVKIRPLGGSVGCLSMILFSILASVMLTVLLNLLLR